MFKMLATFALLVAAASALAGCDESEPRNVTKIVVHKDNPYHAKMLAMSETNRMLALRRAIQDDGGSCPRISDSAYQEQYQGMAMWTVRCSNGDWAVYVAPNGTVQSRPCRHARQLGLPECLSLPEKNPPF